MLNKIKLFFKIRKFYNIFAEEVGVPFITKLSDMTYDNVTSVLFDIDEVRIGYEDCPMSSWLNKLHKQICQIERRDE